MAANKAVIIPREDGGYDFKTDIQEYPCYDADEVGEALEEMLWPILVEKLKERKKITVTID